MKHDGTKLVDKIDGGELPLEQRGAGSHRSTYKTEQSHAAIDKPKERCAVIERLLIDEDDRILETNENNSHLSSHKQIMKSDDSVRYI